MHMGPARILVLGRIVAAVEGNTLLALVADLVDHM